MIPVSVQELLFLGWIERTEKLMIVRFRRFQCNHQIEGAFLLQSERSVIVHLNAICGIVFVILSVLTSSILIIFLAFSLIFLIGGFWTEKRRLKRLDNSLFYYPPDDLSPKKVEKLLLLDRYQGLLFILNIIAFFLFLTLPFNQLESEGLTWGIGIATMFFTLVLLFDFDPFGKELAHMTVSVSTRE